MALGMLQPVDEDIGVEVPHIAQSVLNRWGERHRSGAVAADPCSEERGMNVALRWQHTSPKRSQPSLTAPAGEPSCSQFQRTLLELHQV